MFTQLQKVISSILCADCKNEICDGIFNCPDFLDAKNKIEEAINIKKDEKGEPR